MVDDSTNAPQRSMSGTGERPHESASQTPASLRGSESFTSWSKSILFAFALTCSADAMSQINSGLPPDIVVDRHYQEAMMRLTGQDYPGAASSMFHVQRLVEQNEGLVLPDSYWFHHAKIHEGLEDLATAHQSVTAYLNAEGRDAQHYEDALRLLIRLDDALPAWERRRNLMRTATATVENQLALSGRAALKEELRSGGHGPEMVLVGGGFVPRLPPLHDHVVAQLWEDVPKDTVPSVFVAKYETTIQEFSRFVEDTGYETEGQRLRNNGCSILRDRVGVLSYDRVKGKSRRDWRNPGFAQTDRHPVVCVSIVDARTYALWLSEQTGSTYRLPSDSEWLLTSRAGTYAASELIKSRALLEEEVDPVALGSQYLGGCYGSEDREEYLMRVAGANCGVGGIHYWEPAGEGTLPVGQTKENAIGVFGVWGNASEMTERCFDVEVWGAGMPSEIVVETCRVMGASFRTMLQGYGVSVRPYVYRNDQYQRRNQRFYVPNNSADTGFRVVRDVDDRLSP